jgi:hypothetical protein
MNENRLWKPCTSLLGRPNLMRMRGNASYLTAPRFLNCVLSISLALALALGMLLRTSAATAAPDSVPSAGPIISIGDSFIAGIGAGSYTNQQGCRHSRNSYPAKVAQRMGRQLVDLSCPGEMIPGARSKVARIPRDSAIILVQIGGNDIGFSYLAGACLIAGRATCLGSIARANRILTTLDTPLQDLVRSIHRQAPQAHVIVMGYPLMIGSMKECASIMTGEKVRALTSLQRRLDRALQRSANSSGARFLDWPILVDRHSLCSKDPWYALPGDRLDDVLHPDRRATSAVADRVWRVLN